MKTHPTPGRLRLRPLPPARRVFALASQHADTHRPRRSLGKDFETFRCELRRHDREARHVAAGPCEARDQALGDRVTAVGHDNGRGVRGNLQGKGGPSGPCDDDVGIEPDKLVASVGSWSFLVKRRCSRMRFRLST